ncbi:MAG: hypothetical protein AMJ69_12135 [Gammaproteobacteria bacterium SG8_47]|nr:MAG: hypothetical protein AMJ69_12135 [Gammaproteobacteria bacterium SG8_47]
MGQTLPEPQDLGITIPRYVVAERFCYGFRHALKGGQITFREHLRLSFREGYRAGKLFLREVRRRRGIVNFPMQGRIRLRAAP